MVGLISELNKLQENNVFINFENEHYIDGSNVCFQIEFKDYDYKTYWFNDNHEFGNLGDVIFAIIEISNWYLKDPNRIRRKLSKEKLREEDKLIKNIISKIKN